MNSIERNQKSCIQKALVLSIHQLTGKRGRDMGVGRPRKDGTALTQQGAEYK